MYCVGFTDTLTMSVPLQVLKSLAADQLKPSRSLSMVTWIEITPQIAGIF